MQSVIVCGGSGKTGGRKAALMTDVQQSQDVLQPHHYKTSLVGSGSRVCCCLPGGGAGVAAEGKDRGGRKRDGGKEIYRKKEKVCANEYVNSYFFIKIVEEDGICRVTVTYLSMAHHWW